MKTPETKGRVIVVSGPSGVGKGTVCARVLARDERIRLSVSATTRPKAASEVEGRDYYFLSREDFQRRVADGLFLEYAEVFGNFYGTPKDKVDDLLDAGNHVLLEIDVQGGRQVKRAYPDALMIFILPPDEQTLRTRIQQRGRDTQQSVQTRLGEAKAEIAAALDLYEHRVINDNLERAVEKVLQIIRMAAAKH